jgi:hypothetical protein
MSDPSPLVAIVAVAGALAAGATALSHPRLTVGILFYLASLSRPTLETPLGTMRVEMPAIAVVAVVLLTAGRFATLRSLPRSTLAMALAFGTYLGVLALSSAFVAPGTDQSLHMVAWLATSMTGGALTFVLLRSRPVGAIEPLAFAGAAMGAAGILAAAVFFVAGPTFDLGIQESDAVVPRVYALGWETNLYASFLGMSAFLALEVARGAHRRVGLVGLALTLIGFALGLTRGAYIGLAAGAIAYVAVRLVAERRPSDLPRLGVIAAALLVVGFASANVLLPNALERAYGGGAGIPGPSGSATPSGAASGGASTTFDPTRGPVGTLKPSTDTVAFRLERVPIALDDLRSSPWIGFGAESFGQRHPDRHAGPGQDHIAIMAVVVPYEAGVLGAAAVVIAFVLLLTSLWRSARRSSSQADWRAVGAAAAFIASIVSVLVAYQVTNALHLAVNWIVIGAAAALTSPEEPRTQAQSAL